MKYLVTYQRVPGSESLIAEHLPAHRDLFVSYHQRGDLLAIGPLQKPANGEALAIFTSQESAEEFVGQLTRSCATASRPAPSGPGTTSWSRRPA